MFVEVMERFYISSIKLAEVERCLKEHTKLQLNYYLLNKIATETTKSDIQKGIPQQERPIIDLILRYRNQPKNEHLEGNLAKILLANEEDSDLDSNSSHILTSQRNHTHEAQNQFSHPTEKSVDYSRKIHT